MFRNSRRDRRPARASSGETCFAAPRRRGGHARHAGRNPAREVPAGRYGRHQRRGLRGFPARRRLGRRAGSSRGPALRSGVPVGLQFPPAVEGGRQLQVAAGAVLRRSRHFRAQRDADVRRSDGYRRRQRLRERLAAQHVRRAETDAQRLGDDQHHPCRGRELRFRVIPRSKPTARGTKSSSRVRRVRPAPTTW